jgi:hypothetical protein
MSLRSDMMTKHSLSLHEYAVLQSIHSHMKHRCSNPTDPKYAHYGGRGIHVDPIWLGDGGLDNFIQSMGVVPTGTTIDRIDNDGPYSPDNCKWSTPTEQANNRRVRQDASLITYLGDTKTVLEWSSLVGINHLTIRGRLNKGWPIAEVLGYEYHEVLLKPTLYTYKGVTDTLLGLSGHFGMSVTYIRNRVNAEARSCQ